VCIARRFDRSPLLHPCTICNSDTANKIGTYQLAIAAKYHKVPFFVAAPLTTIDLDMVNGSGIKIEVRHSTRSTLISGSKHVRLMLADVVLASAGTTRR
jgi:methylthioribose-1-phosphate isomerase